MLGAEFQPVSVAVVQPCAEVTLSAQILKLPGTASDPLDDRVTTRYGAGPVSRQSFAAE